MPEMPQKVFFSVYKHAEQWYKWVAERSIYNWNEKEKKISFRRKINLENKNRKLTLQLDTFFALVHDLWVIWKTWKIFPMK